MHRGSSAAAPSGRRTAIVDAIGTSQAVAGSGVTDSGPRKQVWALRHHLVCAPVAGEILSLCLQFESQIQTNLHGRQDRGKLSDQTIANQDRFKLGRDDFVVYPRAFPALPDTPDDVWAFASLGESLKSCPMSAVPDLYWQTLKLRNAIAHGHYVGWPHIRAALRMLRYFDTSA
jgi:hypothetical protein